jgi:hypothetical protein
MLSESGMWTPNHVDRKGVWVRSLTGTKLWVATQADHQQVFLLAQTAGTMVYMPPGWEHAVYTIDTFIGFGAYYVQHQPNLRGFLDHASACLAEMYDPPRRAVDGHLIRTLSATAILTRAGSPPEGQNNIWYIPSSKRSANGMFSCVPAWGAPSELKDIDTKVLPPPILLLLAPHITLGKAWWGCLRQGAKVIQTELTKLAGANSEQCEDWWTLLLYWSPEEDLTMHLYPMMTQSPHPHVPDSCAILACTCKGDRAAITLALACVPDLSLAWLLQRGFRPRVRVAPRANRAPGGGIRRLAVPPASVEGVVERHTLRQGEALFDQLLASRLDLLGADGNFYGSPPQSIKTEFEKAWPSSWSLFVCRLHTAVLHEHHGGKVLLVVIPPLRLKHGLDKYQPTLRSTARMGTTTTIALGQLSTELIVYEADKLRLSVPAFESRRS